jgi:hypothetical protein
VTTSASRVLLGPLLPEFRYGKNNRARAGRSVWFFFRVRNTTTDCIATPQREAGSGQTIAIEKGAPWILEPSATGLCEPDLHVFAKLFEDRLERGLEA